MPLKIKSRGKISIRNSKAQCAIVAQQKQGTRTVTAEKNRQKQERNRQAACSLHHSRAVLNQQWHHSLYPPTDCTGQPSHEPPKRSHPLHTLKPNCFGVARNRTWAGEGISFLIKKIHLYATAFLQRRIPLEMPEDESACIPAGTSKHHHHQKPVWPGDRHENKTHPCQLMLHVEVNSLSLQETAFKLQPML